MKAGNSQLVGFSYNFYITVIQQETSVPIKFEDAMLLCN